MKNEKNNNLIKKKNKNYWVIVALLSFFSHIFFFFILPSNLFQGKIPPVQKRQVAIKFIQPPEKIIPPKKELEKKQIVNSEASNKITPKDDAKYLSNKDNFFKKQTKAEKVGSFKKKLAKNATKKPLEKKVAKKRKSQKKKFNIKDLMMPSTKFSPLNDEDNQEQTIAQNTSKNNAQESQNNDFLDDVPMGTQTNLNTKEFKYFSFYDRIRKKLENYWGVSLQRKAREMFASGNKLAGNNTYITSLKIIINQKGHILNIEVKSSSGKKELDSAAIDSFNQAGPFPNPPSELVSLGKTTIEWGFVVKT